MYKSELNIRHEAGWELGWFERKCCQCMAIMEEIFSKVINIVLQRVLQHSTSERCFLLDTMFFFIIFISDIVFDKTLYDMYDCNNDQ